MESLHQGDEAHLTLYLLQQPQQALRLAQANWAAHDVEAAQPVLELLSQTGMEDIHLSLWVALFNKH